VAPLIVASGGGRTIVDPSGCARSGPERGDEWTGATVGALGGTGGTGATGGATGGSVGSGAGRDVASFVGTALR
jgi:hypothetical protein